MAKWIILKQLLLFSSKKAIEVYAEHAANQAVDYGGIVRALVHSTEGNDWED